MSRQTLLLDAGWKFHLGDIDAPVPNTHIAAYMFNKAGFARGAARGTYDDSDWREVDLPHDWSVEGSFDPNNHVDAGFLPRGIGWYRRYFNLEESDRGKHLAIRFDGVATHCTVWVNGHLVHRNFCGYTPFTIDISDIANFGDTLNCIAVRVDATYMEGWWYEGAGIYRHVWLTKTSPVHIATNGLFVNPLRMSDGRWLTQIEATIENTSDEAMRCELAWEINDRGVEQGKGDAPGKGDTPGKGDRSFSGEKARVPFLCPSCEVAARSRHMVRHSIEVPNPHLWWCDSPNLYVLSCQIRADGMMLDEVKVKFGYRTIRFDAGDGFFLNDQSLKIFGTCNHQDHAGVGVAVPDSIQEFRIRKLKEMGCNAIRSAHNPPAPELLDACDRLGMLVMDENRNFGSSLEHLAQLKAMVKRDRNHPSVILWSICNEEAIQGEPASATIARTMLETVRDLDPSRPITGAVSGGILNDGTIASELDVMSINYLLHTHEPYHAKHPNMPIVSAETNCALSTRGEYHTLASRFVFASYDDEKEFWGNTARETWRAISSRPYVAGMFIWTGFDYRGEPSPHHWPCVNSQFGNLDLCGFPKDSFYLHKAWFTREPFVHLLPHWNWKGREGEEIRVMAMTNCENVELFLDTESLGLKGVDRFDMVSWKVPYRPGELRAIGWSDRQTVAGATVRTTGEATALGLEIDASFRLGLTPADGEFAIPVTVFAFDNECYRVPTASHFVNFTVEGPAKIIGVGNGDPTCHEPNKASSRSLFNGLAQLIVRTMASPGAIVLRASSPGLRSTELRIITQPAPIRPSLPPAPVRWLISDWRMSRITEDRPDPNQTIAPSDMNSWERIDPAHVPQSAWKSKSGYAVYRAAFTPPRSLQPTGGKIVFHQIVGVAEVYLDGILSATKGNPEPGLIEVAFEAQLKKRTISVLIHGATENSGITSPVELHPV